MEKQREDARQKMENRYIDRIFLSSISCLFISSRNIQLLNFPSNDDFFIRSNRAMSVEPNLIAGGKDMKMNNGHHRHYLHHQKSLPNSSTERIDPSSRSMEADSNAYLEENRLAKLKYFDTRQANVRVNFLRHSRECGRFGFVVYRSSTRFSYARSKREKWFERSCCLYDASKYSSY